MAILESTRRPVSKCNMVASHVRNQITSGRLRGGDRIATVAELRNKFQASTAAVDRALFLLSQEGLIDRQQGRGVFVSSAETKTKGLIGYMMPGGAQGQSAYTMNVIRGLQKAVHKRHFELLLLNPSVDEYKSRVDGIIVQGDKFFNAHGAPTSDVPMVSVMATSVYGPSVIGDDYQGISSLVNHLVGLGHKRIATLMWPDQRAEWSGRVSAYIGVMNTIGIEPDPRWMHDLHFFLEGAETSIGMAYATMEEWLHGDWAELGCTALICQNDDVAAGAIRAARDFGLDVPGDLSITGYDATEDRLPEITSVRVPIEQIAFKAAELLMEHIDGKDDGLNRVMYKTSLLSSKSSGPVKSY